MKAQRKPSANPIEQVKQVVNSQRGAIGYLVAWLLGVPVTVLLIIFLLRGGT